MTVRIDPTAIIEEGVCIGEGTTIWDSVHIRHGSRLGAQCIVGGKTYIAYQVHIGDRVKINSFVYICHGVTIDDGVMIGAGTVFTNDRFPRACTADLKQLRSSDPDENTLLTRVGAGATIGARSVIGADLHIGPFAMVGMGTVVTHSVDRFHLAFGNPVRSQGCVCRCGNILKRWTTETMQACNETEVACSRCQRHYSIESGVVVPHASQ